MSPSHVQVLKEYGKICSFSPCIEQVQKFCEELRSNEFDGNRHLRSPRSLSSEIVTIELIPRPYRVDEYTTDGRSMYQLRRKEKKQLQQNPKKRTRDNEPAIAQVETVSMATPLNEIRGTFSLVICFLTFAGHSGFLTFARRALVFS